MESELSLGLPGLSLGLPELSLGLPCTFHGSPKLSEAPRGRKSILTSRRMILWEHRTRSEQDRKVIFLCQKTKVEQLSLCSIKLHRIQNLGQGNN